jgi:hypothetical protein
MIRELPISEVEDVSGGNVAAAQTINAGSYAVAGRSSFISKF